MPLPWDGSAAGYPSPYCEPPLCASEARAPPFTALEDVPPCPLTVSSNSRNCHIDYLGTYSLFNCIFHNFVFYIVLYVYLFLSNVLVLVKKKKKKKKK